MSKVETEANLMCPSCRVIVYRIMRKQTRTGSDIWSNALEGATPDVPMPEDPKHLVCPACHKDLVRE
jgi:uncharacterized protein YbaR (Trm112 family)